MSSKPDAPFSWTTSQRRVLLLLLALFFAFLVARYARNPAYVSDPQPDRPPRYDELADRIDPNTADWQALAALPGIGERKARDVVEYRERKRAEARDPTLVVFDAEGDLLYVRGIGPALVEAMKPHLVFPATNRSATTRAL